MNEPLTYAAAGVDIDEGERLVELIRPFASATRRAGADGSVGGFGGVFDLGALAYRDPLLVAANDGVGTKLRLAIEMGLHGTVGIDLVAMCVNDLVVQGAEPLFFLDYYATGALDADAAASVVEGIAAGCRDAGCALLGGETAEMPGMYRDGDYDLAGFAVGLVEREQLLPKPVRTGDVLIGLASSGAHSNGYSLVRRVVERSGLALDGAAPFVPAMTLGAALLEPTRIYVRAVRGLLKTGHVKAIAHITGGGFTQNLPRVLGDEHGAVLELDAFPDAPLFRWIAETGSVSEDEMLRTFNCGFGMVLAVAPDHEVETLDRLREFGETARTIGTVRDGAGVEYNGKLFG